MVVQHKGGAVFGATLAIFGSQRGFGLLRLLRLPLGDPLRDGAALQKPACLNCVPCALTARALATCRDRHKSAF